MMPSFRDGRFHGEGGFFLVPPHQPRKSLGLTIPYSNRRPPLHYPPPHGADGDDACLQELPAPGAWATSLLVFRFWAGELGSFTPRFLKLRVRASVCAQSIFHVDMSTNGTTDFSVGGQPSPSTFKDKGFLILLSKGLQQSDAYSLQFE
ncbi:hypothetical protein CISG_06507 [Coccidioides immitis RMSCC 3703]|uniref:Uncharacterized protein n=2 Tax=Coccidioides immitis TaxID=5501 RepID=A0A0J8QZM0_COCIT|nr:hypothetical protein CIRG_04421 [Coccidioides immitis RMSCC 2394]KMU77505.1 hypothetical protein CISG_06507 [Coccidioides immitis RMSCC 3703]